MSKKFVDKLKLCENSKSMATFDERCGAENSFIKGYIESMKKPAASPAQPELGPFQRTFTTDDPVAITEAFGLPKGTLSNGKIMGCAVRGLIDFYIVKLDEPYIHPQTGEMWRALSVPSNCLEALN